MANNLDHRDASALVVAVATRRDRQAFESLFRYFAPRVKTYLLRRGVNTVAAEDIVQEAMLMVWRKAPLFHPSKASVSAWVYTIARNLYVDMIRREHHPKLDAEVLSFVPDPQPGADCSLVRMQDEAMLRHALLALPPEQKEVLELSFFAEKPHSVIAKELALPIGTVKSRVRLALKRMRAPLLP